jgi:hypothetical protein
LGLRLFGDARAFADALAASSDGLYSICNRDRLGPAEVMRLERLAEDRSHRDPLGIAALRAEAEPEVESYFREAARADPDRLFAYSSKVVLSVPEYQDLQKIFLLRRRFGADASAEALVFVPEARLRRLFTELFNDAQARHTVALPGSHAWARFARTLLRTLVHRARRARARVLVFTLSSGTSKLGADAYFGNFASTLAARASTLTVYLASGPRVRLPRNSATVPFEAFVSALTVLSAWLSALVSGPWAVSARVPSGELAPLHRYMRRAEVRSGEYFMQRLLARGFGAMLDRVSPEVLVYPFENRTWEKHLLAQAQARGIRRVAYQHSSITPRHLAFAIREGEIPAAQLPDRVITLGEHTAALLRRSAPPLADRIAVGASLRTSRQSVTEAVAPAVLVAISSSRSEALSLLQATHAAAVQVGVPFIVRTHPTIPVDDMFALFQWPRNVELSDGRTLATDLSRVSMIAYSSSTVALEGMLYGRLPIFVDIGDCPSGDPIDGEHAFKFSARGGAALAAEIGRISALDSAALASPQAAASAYAESYLRAATPEAIEAMAEAIVRS